MNTLTTTLLTRTALAAAIALSTVSANAALYNRGNGMIYDSSLNITWLQDPNYSKTSGYDADGGMTWQQATDWAANLVYGGFNDWRLSSAGVIGNSNYSFTGSTDTGYNNTRSEIGHLFLELGNLASYSTSGSYQPVHGFTNTSFVDARTGQIVSFLNLNTQNDVYWEAETYAPYPVDAWFFVTNDGFQSRSDKASSRSAWAVRAGDVGMQTGSLVAYYEGGCQTNCTGAVVPPPSEVPLPAAAWLMGSGLIGLAGIARRRKLH